MIAAAVAQTSSSSIARSPVSAAVATHERRRAVELRGLLLAGRPLQRGERGRAEHPEAPRLVEVVRRRETRDREELEQRLAR